MIIGSIVRLLPRHPHLKVVIASATIDKARFQKFFTERLPGNLRCEIVNMSGQTYGTTAHFRPANLLLVPYERQILRELNESIAGYVAQEVVWLLQSMNNMPTPRCLEPSSIPPGDIVAFLHGRQPIDAAVKQIQDQLAAFPTIAARTDVLPLYRELTDREKQLAIGEKGNPDRRRVVVSSNLAETSLTIEGIVHVVDSGIIKVNRWDPETERTRLTPMTHSQGGCKQRWGRRALGPDMLGGSTRNRNSKTNHFFPRRRRPRFHVLLLTKLSLPRVEAAGTNSRMAVFRGLMNLPLVNWQEPNGVWSGKVCSTRRVISPPPHS